jgi:hypothetical protein
VHGFSMKHHPGFDPAAAGPAWQQAATLLRRIAPA